MLNILPLQQKKELKLKKTFDSLKKTIVLIWLLLLLPAGLLITTHYLLVSINNEIADTAMPNSQEELRNVAIISQVFNNNLKKSESMQQNHLNPVIILEHFTQLIPAGVMIKGINISMADKTIAFSGEAGTRDQLLELENGLSNDDMFKDFTYPLSNLSEKENIKFDLSGKIEL